ncbi:MAG TPA: hypothetical protein VKU82_00975, partial [Planctomycetaceae bacterium]|nr:hypothetical protein [Planctomycetaceae bacterium]
MLRSRHSLRRKKVSLVLVGALLAALLGRPAAAASDEPPGADRDMHHLVLLAPAHPVFIQVRVEVDGRGLKSVRTAYAARLVKQYDKNGDEFLDREEAKAVPPLVQSPTASQTVSIADRWEAVDHDPADDKVSLDELAAYIDRLFGSTFLLSIRPERATQNIDLFALLDLNRDGRLSRDEFGAAAQTLHKLDLDSDETFTIDELQPFRNPQIPQAPAVPQTPATDQPFLLLEGADSIATAVDKLRQRYGDAQASNRTNGLARKGLGIDAEAFAAFDANGDESLSQDELAVLLSRPPPHVIVEAQLLQSKPGRPKLAVIEDRLGAASKESARGGGKVAISTNGISIELRVQANRAAVADNRTFYKLKFRTADQDKNKYLSEQEFPAVGLTNADFKSVDRNGDGMIFEDELMAYVEQESASSQSRVELVISHDGKSVFEVIDANLDRRISRRELANAIESLGQYDLNGDGAITAVEMAGRFQAVLQLGKPVMFRNL